MLVVGPLTDHMRLPLQKTFDAMPTPKRVIAVGPARCRGRVRAQLSPAGPASPICCPWTWPFPAILPRRWRSFTDCSWRWDENLPFRFGRLAEDCRRRRRPPDEPCALLIGLFMALCGAGVVLTAILPNEAHPAGAGLGRHAGVAAADWGKRLDLDDRKRVRLRLWAVPSFGTLLLRMDCLSALFSLITGLVFLPVSIFCAGYLPRYLGPIQPAHLWRHVPFAVCVHRGDPGGWRRLAVPAGLGGDVDHHLFAGELSNTKSRPTPRQVT